MERRWEKVLGRQAQSHPAMVCRCLRSHLDCSAKGHHPHPQKLVCKSHFRQNLCPGLLLPPPPWRPISLNWVALAEHPNQPCHRKSPQSHQLLPGLATNSIFFCFLFGKKSLICLKGKSMTPHRENTILFRSSQQLPRLRLGPSKGFLS